MDSGVWAQGVFGADQAGDGAAERRRRLITTARSCVESVFGKEGGQAGARVFAPVMGFSDAWYHEHAQREGMLGGAGGHDSGGAESNVLIALQHLLDVRFAE